MNETVGTTCSALTPVLQIDEVLTLDLLTLREHTELAGDVLDAQTHRKSIEASMKVSEVAAVRRSGALVAYAMLQPREKGCWFVTGFNTHPAHRNASTFRDLFEQISVIARRHAITSLKSNVYKTNRLSMAFHKRLGFKVTNENARGVEFHANLDDLKASPSVLRSALPPIAQHTN
jgi:hypothetical protein